MGCSGACSGLLRADSKASQTHRRLLAQQSPVPSEAPTQRGCSQHSPPTPGGGARARARESGGARGWALPLSPPSLAAGMKWVSGLSWYFQGSCRQCHSFSEWWVTIPGASLQEYSRLEGWQWLWAQAGRGDGQMPGVEVTQQCLGLTERGDQSLVGPLCPKQPVARNPEKLHVLWLGLFEVLLHPLGSEEEPQPRPSPRAQN